MQTGIVSWAVAVIFSEVLNFSTQPCYNGTVQRYTIKAMWSCKWSPTDMNPKGYLGKTPATKPGKYSMHDVITVSTSTKKLPRIQTLTYIG